MKNKDLRRNLLLYIGGVGILGAAGAIVPYWYDDVGHSLTVFCLLKTGEWAFPLSYPDLKVTAPHSTMITLGPALHYPAVLFSKLFGWSFFSLRLLMILLNAFFPILIDRFSRTYFKPSSSLWAVGLLLVNLQFCVYGSQYVGEVLMMQMLGWGLYFQLRFFTTSKRNYIVLSQVFFSLAVLTKEYIILPLGLYLLFGWVYASVQRTPFKTTWLLQGLVLPLVLVPWYAFQFHSIAEFLHYWQMKRDYQAEFFYFGQEAIAFILKKPLITLGFIAIWVKVLVQRNLKDILIATLQGILLLFFLSTQGFERMGLWLVPFSVLYLAEWLHFLWSFLWKSFSSRLILLTFCVLGFGQNTFNPFYWKRQWEKNETLKQIASKIQEAKIPEIYTYELELLPYLRNVRVWTTDIPPISHWRISRMLQADYFLVGPYAKTEYYNTYRPADYVKAWEYKGYELWKNKSLKISSK